MLIIRDPQILLKRPITNVDTNQTTGSVKFIGLSDQLSKHFVITLKFEHSKFDTGATVVGNTIFHFPTSGIT
jgi:hypothetical protein